MKTQYGIYIHIPFCRSKCSYCSFISRPGNRELQERYCRAVLVEMQQFGRSQDDRYGADTIYFGGGTPSLLPAELIKAMLACAKDRFLPGRAAEITLEANPGTICPDKAEDYRRMGINRVSLGAQSFQEKELSEIGRLHTANQIGESVQTLRASGIDNLSLDLMLGLPGQTWESWQDTLERAAALEPGHISVYMLELEEKTALFRRAAKGTCALPTDDLVADLYLRSLDLLRSYGYAQYEISNFARAGFECRHNLKYWRKEPYLGFGVGSHSQDGHVRHSNYSNLAIYLRAIESGHSPLAQRRLLSRKAELGETMFLGLRLNQGLLREKLEEHFGPQRCAPVWASLERAEEDGLVEWTGTRVRLTPRGMLLSNEVFQNFVMM